MSRHGGVIIDDTSDDTGRAIDPWDVSFHAALLDRFAPGGVTTALDLFNLVCVPGLTDVETITALSGTVAVAGPSCSWTPGKCRPQRLCSRRCRHWRVRMR